METTKPAESPTRYRVVRPDNHALVFGNLFFSESAGGWIFAPMCQMGRSRRAWPTPAAALNGRIANYELVAH